MLFCDIGNSNASFLDDNKFFTLNIEQFLEFKSEQKIFYINVNEHIKEHLKARKNFINLEPYFVFDTIY
ncbi:TPA: pantothenate kinase, partial [Campylobacter coli]|nr:pantothenate kinase [Campylobacter coli]